MPIYISERWYDTTTHTEETIPITSTEQHLEGEISTSITSIAILISAIAKNISIIALLFFLHYICAYQSIFVLISSNNTKKPENIDKDRQITKTRSVSVLIST
jgi:hypothetical protein